MRNSPVWSVVWPVLLASAALAADPPLRSLAQGVNSGVEKPTRKVVRTQAEWTRLWAEHAPDENAALPKVDWSREMVLAAFMGRRNTGGYRIQVRSAAETKGKLVVQLTETSPGPDSLVPQSLTEPFHFVAVPRSNLPVEWKITTERR